MESETDHQGAQKVGALSNWRGAEITGIDDAQGWAMGLYSRRPPQHGRGFVTGLFLQEGTIGDRAALNKGRMYLDALRGLAFANNAIEQHGQCGFTENGFRLIDRG